MLECGNLHLWIFNLHSAGITVINTINGANARDSKTTNILITCQGNTGWPIYWPRMQYDATSKMLLTTKREGLAVCYMVIAEQMLRITTQWPQFSH